jgi:hypothetical protein
VVKEAKREASHARAMSSDNWREVVTTPALLAAYLQGYLQQIITKWPETARKDQRKVMIAIRCA